MFILSENNRILRENDPDHSSGPLLFFAGCAEGNQLYLHQRVSHDISSSLSKLLADKPSWSYPDTRPVALPTVLPLLGSVTPIMTVERSLIYQLPRQSVVANDLTFVCSGTEERAELLYSLEHFGSPQHLVDAGFVSVNDFWSPWCAIMDGHTIAALAFAARLGTHGAEIGVYTFPGWRSRGLAAAATAKWSSLPALAGLKLFYSTSTNNRSSQRVAERLGLQCFAAGLRIDQHPRLNSGRCR